MPPVQCPECGRFLKKSFVASLADEPAPCPGCETELRPELFDAPTEGSAAPTSTSASSGSTEPETASDTSDTSDASDTDANDTSDSGTSVRPPDLAPEEVRDHTDVLSGWDSGVGQQLDAWATDRPPFPTDAVVVAGAGLAGLAIGAVVGRDRRATAAAAGATVGILSAAVARRIWRLDV